MTTVQFQIRSVSYKIKPSWLVSSCVHNLACVARWLTQYFTPYKGSHNERGPHSTSIYHACCQPESEGYGESISAFLWQRSDRVTVSERRVGLYKCEDLYPSEHSQSVIRLKSSLYTRLDWRFKVSP